MTHDAVDLISCGSSHRALTLRRILFDPVDHVALAPPTAEPKLLTAREAAKALAVCERTLAALTSRGEIPVIRIGRAIRYDPRDLMEWIEKSKVLERITVPIENL